MPLEQETVQSTQVSGSTNGWLTQINYGGKTTYSASTSGTVTVSGTANAVTSIAYLFHPSGSTKRYQINKISITWAIGSGSSYTFRLARITAENAVPGGATQLVSPVDPNDAASTAIFRSGATGAPTRQAGDLFCWVAPGTGNGEWAFSANDYPEGKPLTCRAITGEGWEIRTVVSGTSLTTSPQVTVSMVWTEE